MSVMKLIQEPMRASSVNSYEFIVKTMILDKKIMLKRQKGLYAIIIQ